MTLAGLGPVAWPSPLTAAATRVDPFGAATVDADGRLAVSFGSGAEVAFVATIPAEGVLRLRTGGAAIPSPMLVAFDDVAATVHLDGDAVRLHGAGVDACWRDDGRFEVGTSFRRAPADTRVRAGRLLDADGAPSGWLETIDLGAHTQVYGGGESNQGPDLRGRVRRLFNSETHGNAGLDWTYLNVPFLWSGDGWGLFVHTGAPVIADVGATHVDVAAIASEGPDLDLFVIVGDTPTELLQRYLALTGTPGRFPPWALGVWSSRCSYLSEDEVGEIVRGYRDAECPVDVVHVDAWVTGNVVRDLACNWTVDRERFPEGWGRRLADQGVRLSLWHNPYVLVGSDRDTELREAGLLVVDDHGSACVTADKRDRHVIDFTAPGAVAWWKARVRETVEAEGNASFKPDFGEELPLDGRLADGRSGREARNEYALRYQAATHEGLVEAGAGDDGVALFCRSGTAGAQRYPCHWVGDTPSTWPGLVSALRASLSLSLSGFGFVASDVGGFWTGGSHGWVHEAFEVMDNTNVPADVEPELFARWTQWGALSPVLRFHGTGRREPWAYPGEWGAAAVEACRLRARMRPYLERVSAEASSDGVPMMRPMALAFPDDATATRAAPLQYLLGPDVLVAPIVTAGGRHRVWIPEGDWDPLVGLDRVEGPRWIEVTCGPTQFPAWVRRGATVT